MPKDYYAVLGVSRDASAEDVKSAYRRLSKELHPDKHKGDRKAEERFKEVNEAYEVLSNPKKRQMYDQFGSAFAGGMHGAKGAAGFGDFGFDFSSFMGDSSSAGDLGDLFKSFFGGGFGHGEAPSHGGGGRSRGADREVEIEISLREVQSGVAREIAFRRIMTCEECSGSGARAGSKIISCGDCSGTGSITRTTRSLFGVIQQQRVCPRCRGAGKIPEHACRACDGSGRRAGNATVTVHIPRGIADGQTLRVRGEGDAGERAATVGDLYVTVRVREDPSFRRESDDIHAIHAIPVHTAILGGTVAVPTLHGDVSLKIPEGTQSHQVFKIKGKGLPRLGGSSIGDHFVTMHVEIPKKLSREERRLLEEWKNLRC